MTNTFAKTGQAGMLVICLGVGVAAAAPGGTPPEKAAPVAAPVSLTADWIGEGNQPSARLGWHAETAGDVNGDGLADIVGGAFMRPNAGAAGAGAAYLYYGRHEETPHAAPDWLFACQDEGANCGFAVASAGDVNGDGFDDVLVGANYQAAYQSSGIPERGRVYLFLGGPAGLSLTPSWTASPDAPGTMLGSGVSGAGDLNGDGYADIVATAPDYSNGQAGEGHVLLWYGSPDGPGPIPDWSFEPNIPGAALTQATAAGDVDGDGYGDLLVGGRQPGGVSHVWLFHGDPVGLVAQPDWTAQGQNGAQFGFMVNSAGDVNGDGYDDVLVASDLHDDGEVDEGAAFLWLGGPGHIIEQGITGTPANADWSYEGDQSFSYLRWADGVGDFTGDGYDDVVLGHALYSGGQAQEGRILIFAGSATGLGAQPVFVAESDLAGARLGWAAEAAGDVNGDGAPDIVAGAERYTNGQFEEGALFLFFGSPACTDRDGDGYGLPGSRNCPGGSAQDCNDTSSFVHPGQHEVCNCTDDDCNGFIDDGVYCPDDLGCGALDNCPFDPNPNQSDVDGDNIGDICDNCPFAANAGQEDTDGDGIGDACDNCPAVANPGQANSDGDTFGNACDSCPNIADEGGDIDQDGFANACDNCPGIANSNQADADADGVGDLCDSCPSVPNATQADTDFDGIGDNCDNCPSVANPAQGDQDFDLIGDACDPCPTIPAPPGAACTGDPVEELFIDVHSPAGRGSGLITWTTSSEVGVTGFNLVVLDAGTRTQINAAIIPCQMCSSGLGASYASIIPKHKSGKDIFLEMIRVDGSVVIHGPAKRK
ncbi:MAG TPA: FG-GAP-like repeat-containing protein [Candidatus Polarisedimenticolia bacterium]|nr:FG-GAP-like repeat-containing protein [Candidatus Polarisedimenticolia bacterium]